MDLNPVHHLKKAVHDVGKAVGKAVHDTGKAAGHAVEQTTNVVTSVVNNPTKIVTDPLKVATKAVNDTGTAVSKGIKDTGKTIEKAGSDIGNVDYGEELFKIGKVVGEYLSDVLQVGWASVYYGDKYLLNGNLDKYTGGMVTSVENVAEAPRAIASGDKADDNIKDAVRVSMVTAAVLLTGGAGAGAAASLSTSAVVAGVVTAQQTAGMSEGSWGQVIDTMAQKYLPAPIANIVSKVANPPQQVNYQSTYTPTSAADLFTYEGSPVTPIIVVGGGAVIVLLLMMKLKKH